MQRTEPPDIRNDFLHTESPRMLLVLNLIFALAYFIVLAVFFPQGNPVLFWLLIIGEVFHMWQVATFIYTVWNTTYEAPHTNTATPSVDVFVTVAGEPIDIVEQTVRAVIGMRYGGEVRTYILNDGYVAQKDNWRDAETLAQRLTSPMRSVECITRTVPGGAKAGNINNALTQTRSPLVAVFDADHVPHEDFLEKTVSYFVSEQVGFVQTPQFYKNYAHNYLTQSSWDQQELFYGAISRGKNHLRSVWMCGTNMLISRAALTAAGGMCTESIAEDAITGLRIHQLGYYGVYVPEVLAEGLATEDLLTYTKQQYRWARGSMDIIFRYNPFFMKGLTFAQRIQYLASASFYLTGLVVVVDILIPVVFLYTGLVPVKVEGMMLAAAFLPYLLFTLYTIQRVSNYTFTYPSLGLSMSSFHIHIQALIAAVTRRRSSFAISSKVQLSGNFLSLALPHFLYIAVAAGGVVVALLREGFSASFVNNVAWIGLNITVFMPYIRAALPDRKRAVQPARRASAALSGLLHEPAYGNA